MGSMCSYHLMTSVDGAFFVYVTHMSILYHAQYYLGENGEPVTDSTITGQKLFIPISDTKLAINM